MAKNIFTNFRCFVFLFSSLTIADVFIGCKENNRQARVYYVPIGSETFNPINVTTIEVPDYMCIVEADEASDVHNVIASSSPSDGSAFTPDKIRVMLRSNHKGAGDLTSAVDNNGGVRHGNQYGLLSKSKLSALKEILEQACLPKWKAEAEKGAEAAAAREQRMKRSQP